MSEWAMRVMNAIKYIIELRSVRVREYEKRQSAKE